MAEAASVVGPVVADAPDAPDARAAFLARTPAAGWRRAPLAGDASARAYERVHGPAGATAVLMDARAEPASVPPFLRIAAHLRSLGLAAPRVLAGDGAAGLLLLEDLGGTTAAAWLAGRPGDAPEIYGAAVDALAHLQAAAPPPGLVALTPERLTDMVAPLWQHYAPGPAEAVARPLRDALAAFAPDPTALSLRDFHAENLIWRPGRAGLDRLGLLDFQDAVLAPPEYDLASLLTDARRDVDAALRAFALRRFAQAAGRAEADVAAAAAALGVARNLRVLGVLARLARAGRPAYLRLLPRVWGHLAADLRHPALAALREAVLGEVPPPSRAFVEAGA